MALLPSASGIEVGVSGGYIFGLGEKSHGCVERHERRMSIYILFFHLESGNLVVNK